MAMAERGNECRSRMLGTFGMAIIISQSKVIIVKGLLSLYDHCLTNDNESGKGEMMIIIKRGSDTHNVTNAVLV